jgi:hypothetical protein
LLRHSVMNLFGSHQRNAGVTVLFVIPIEK